MGRGVGGFFRIFQKLDGARGPGARALFLKLVRALALGISRQGFGLSRNFVLSWPFFYSRRMSDLRIVLIVLILCAGSALFLLGLLTPAPFAIFGASAGRIASLLEES